MELETRSCPGCGAPVSVHKGVRSYRCEYCGNEFSIDNSPSFEEEKEQIRLQMERDKAKAYKDRLAWENKEYKKQQRRNQKRAQRSARTSSCVGCFLILLVPIIFISVIAYRTINEQLEKYEYSSYDADEAGPEVITDLDKIPKVTLDKINRTSAKKSDGHFTALYSGWYVAEKAEPVGDYLVSYDDNSGNYLISVMKITYKNDKKKLEQSIYTAYYTNDICLKEDGTTVQSHPERLIDYCKNLSHSMYLKGDGGSIPSLVSGWESLKELYADCIDSSEKKYHISYTKNMYIPGKSESLSKSANYIPSIGIEVDEGQSEEIDYNEKKSDKE